MAITSIERAFQVTGRFEGGEGYATLSGSFDSQGLSYGFLQWNFGQGTLQPLLKDFYRNGPQTFKKCCTQFVTADQRTLDLTATLLQVCEMRPADAVRWWEQRQDEGHRLLPHWVRAFKAMAAEPGFQALQRKHAGYYVGLAWAAMERYGFKSERALCLLFDIMVQCGSITLPSRARYLWAARNLTDEASKLEALARAVAPQGGRWAADVLQRKLAIALGKGVVHGAPINLASDFDVTMRDVVTTLAAAAA